MTPTEKELLTRALFNYANILKLRYSDSSDAVEKEVMYSRGYLDALCASLHMTIKTFGTPVESVAIVYADGTLFNKCSCM